MKLNSSEAPVYTDSGEVQEHFSVELDLYGDLRTFEQLTPEEQARLSVHTEIEGEQDNSPKEVAQSTEYVADLQNTPLGSVDSTVAEKKNFADDVEQQSLSDADANVVHAQIEGDTDNSKNESLLSPSESGDEDYHATEVGSGSLTGELGHAIASESELGSAAIAQTIVEERSDAIEAGSDIFVKDSDPIENLDGGVEFNGALSRGVCLACGAESSTDDLFCPACDVFIEDIS
jgi:hypothetical protein